MKIRPAAPSDWPEIWPIFHSIVAPGDTYAYDPDTTYDQGFKIWMTTPRAVFVAVDNDRIVGTYYIKTNQHGGGAHVCNCGFMVSADATGQGIARAMCIHAQAEATKLGYHAMQFNFVVETNAGAVHLWQDMGFDVVGRLPKAFEHPDDGYVDALVMWKGLG